jgi:hypothetical protein
MFDSPEGGLMLLVPPPLFRSVVPLQTLTYIGRATETAFNVSTTTKSFDFGAPSPNRHILVMASFYVPTLSSCTVLGVAAPLIKSNYVGAGSKAAACLATVPNGTVGNVVITLSSGSTSGGISIDCWRIDKATLPTLVDSEAVSTSTQNYSNSGIVVPADGGMVMALRSGYMGGTRSFTWTGLTENSDAVMATGANASAASAKFTSGQNPLTIGVNCSGSMSEAAAFTAVCLQ